MTQTDAQKYATKMNEDAPKGIKYTVEAAPAEQEKKFGGFYVKRNAKAGVSDPHLKAHIGKSKPKPQQEQLPLNNEQGSTEKTAKPSTEPSTKTTAQTSEATK